MKKLLLTMISCIVSICMYSYPTWYNLVKVLKDPVCPTSGNWGYNAENYNNQTWQVTRYMDVFLGDHKVSLTGNISLRHTVFVGVDTGTDFGNLTIENGTDHEIIIWDDLDNPADGTSADRFMTLFTVWEGSTLTIRGKKNAPIIIDGNSKNRNLITKFGFLESTGRLILENVIIRNVKFDETNAAAGECSALKLHPYYSQSSTYFYLMGKTTLKNVTMTDIEMPGGAGAAISCYLKTQDSEENTRENCTVELYDCTFKNITQTGKGPDGNGGIIRFRGDWVGDLKMQNCLFENNTSTYSCAGVYWNSMGWKADPCKLTVNGCTFRNNKVTGEGQNAGALMIEGNCEFIGNPTTFENNSCTQYGGAIFIHNYNGTDAVQQTSFNASINDKVILKNNKAAHGGGVCVRIDDNSTLASGTSFAVSLDGATFEGNEASLEGGGLKIDRGSDKYPFRANLNKGAFRNNKAGNGGAIYSYRADINYADASSTFIFEGNTAVNNGGGIYANACPTFKLNNVSFNGNTATNHDASAVYITNETNMTVESATMTNGNANKGYGGAIYSNNSTLTINDCQITTNTAGSRGGGIYAQGSTVKLGKGVIKNNKTTSGASKDDEGGGGIYLYQSSFEMNNGEISNNQSTANGGGVFYVNRGGSAVRNFIFGGGTISNNTTNGHGGGICILTGSPASTFKLLGGDINGNTAEDGGGVYFNGWTNNVLQLEKTDVQYNTAKAGGGVLVYYGKMNYNNGLIRYNKAIARSGQTKPSSMYWQNHCGASDDVRPEIHGVGGGLLVSTNGQVNFVGTESFGIYGNTAEYGGDDILANGDRTKITLPDVTKMKLTDFSMIVPQSSLFWAQDYIEKDNNYSHCPNVYYDNNNIERYTTRIAKYASIGEIAPGTYGPGSNKDSDKNYVSVTLGYQYVFIDVIKKGLKAGETALIDIYQGSNVSGDPYMRISLTGKDGASEIKRKVALYAGEWTVVENGWSWTYQAKASTIKRTLTKNSSAADKTFTFENVKQTKLPNAESIKVNDNMKK